MRQLFPSDLSVLSNAFSATTFLPAFFFPRFCLQRIETLFQRLRSSITPYDSLESFESPLRVYRFLIVVGLQRVGRVCLPASCFFGQSLRRLLQIPSCVYILPKDIISLGVISYRFTLSENQWRYRLFPFQRIRTSGCQSLCLQR
jgi:hypothetical protein